jgi:hypothetical protein
VLALIGYSAGCYPKIKKRPKDLRSCSQKVEFQLGYILADAVGVVAGGLLECWNGLTPETKERFANLMGQLGAIWQASLFSSYNAERRQREPYFENRPQSHPRMTFGEAVQRLGMDELTFRYFDVPEPILHELLMFVLKCFGDALDRIVPPEERKRRIKDAVPLEKLVRLLNAVAPRSASASVPSRVN